MRARLEEVSVALSACRLELLISLDSFVRGHKSNGLVRIVLFFGVTSAVNLLVDRVVRRVSGGDTGAYLGASGVSACL